MRSGLLGPADITEDGYIEYSEIQAFVRAANHRVSDPKAKLDIYVHAPVQDRNRPLLDLLTLRDAVLLDMPKTASGRYYLEDHRGIRLADFNKSEEQHLTLALLSSKTNYLREKEGGVEYEIHPAEQRRIRFSELTPRPYEMAPRGAVERSFRAHLFTLPFGRGFYAGVVDGLEIGGIVEIIAGPFKGMQAKVVRVDASKEEVTVEILEAAFTLPITVHADYVRELKGGA